MANIKGSQKRAELAEVRREANRFNKKTARTAIARLRSPMLPMTQALPA